MAEKSYDIRYSLEGVNKMSIAPVSAIVPCYRCADTIERAVTSVVSQTQRPYELILVDDASGDDTLKMLQNLRDRFGTDWINVIPLPQNGGPSLARNKGWEMATQPYIAFLDADDAWHPCKIEIQHNWMKNHPNVALTGHDCIWIKSDEFSYTDLPREWKAWHISPRHLLLSNKLPTRSVMLRRDIPLRFELTKRYSEDYLLWLQIVLSGYDAWRLELPLAYLFKAPYGEGGLSSDLLKMERGELDTYHGLHKTNLINKWVYLFFSVISIIKFLRRLF